MLLNLSKFYIILFESVKPKFLFHACFPCVWKPYNYIHIIYNCNSLRKYEIRKIKFSFIKKLLIIWNLITCKSRRSHWVIASLMERKRCHSIFLWISKSIGPLVATGNIVKVMHIKCNYCDHISSFYVIVPPFYRCQTEGFFPAIWKQN